MFTLIVFIISCVYYDDFDFGLIETWMWFGLYLALPINCAYFLITYRGGPRIAREPLPRPMRICA